MRRSTKLKINDLFNATMVFFAGTVFGANISDLTGYGEPGTWTNAAIASFLAIFFAVLNFYVRWK